MDKIKKYLLKYIPHKEPIKVENEGKTSEYVIIDGVTIRLSDHIKDGCDFMIQVTKFFNAENYVVLYGTCATPLYFDEKELKQWLKVSIFNETMKVHKYNVMHSYVFNSSYLETSKSFCSLSEKQQEVAHFLVKQQAITYQALSDKAKSCDIKGGQTQLLNWIKKKANGKDCD